MRPPLTRNIQIKDFKNYYWLKTELQEFCREYGLPTSKIEITECIIAFLTTGKVPEKQKTSKKKITLPSHEPFSLQTIITENHRCSEDVRAFFKDIIGLKFRFTVALQNFFKENIGRTYEDAVKFWYEEQERKKDPSYKTDIGTQFEYNRFTRAFFQDSNNQGKSKSDAIAAWKEIKAKPGSNAYEPKKVEN
ncbi:DUF6434 domain-containing protein [Bacillus gaemokensis]|uniref:DUF6434 domain-containing protein n=1 Tax=Bacillus gaemokensis TaxID=574375 RepID=A0A073K9I1_9BACI|nr:DUF6434 domain-containing protein [Bacillus gaemokensis]KEK23206.1 hypothetical protein BAGA_10655 [Bacillus gaemokensis]KYG37670.1 cytoplasmic protein [Bacillus gaemokensis]